MEELGSCKNIEAAAIDFGLHFVQSHFTDEDVLAFMKLHMLAEDPTAYHMHISEGASLLHSKGSDMETLLDSMLIDYQALQCLIDSLHVKLTTAEQAVSLRLDTSRNELLVASTVISVLACTIGVASVSGDWSVRHEPGQCGFPAACAWGVCQCVYYMYFAYSRPIGRYFILLPLLQCTPLTWVLGMAEKKVFV